MKNKKARLWMRTAILVVFLAAVAYTLLQVFSQKEAVAEGDTAPVFQLKTLNGKAASLKDLRGKGILLNFWGSWCKPCKEEMPFINQAYQKKIKGVEIIGVNIGESPYVVNNFVNRYNLQFPIWLDRDKVVTDRYKVDQIPTTYLIDKNGQVVKKIIGPMTSPEDVINQLRLIQP